MNAPRFMPGHYAGDGCTFPDPGHRFPRDEAETYRARHYADRLLAAQPVARGQEQPNGSYTAIPAAHVAAVLHALADYTHNAHMLSLAAPAALPSGVDTLGRYFHALADSIDQRIHYVVCNRLLDPEDNLHCEFDGRVLIDDHGRGTCPWCHGTVHHQTPSQETRDAS